MAVIKIPDGKGGWIKLPTVKGEPGKDGTEVTKEDIENALRHTVNSDVPADAKFTDTVLEIDNKTIVKNDKGEIEVAQYILPPDDYTDSPGPKYLVGGDMNAGYFGTVSTSELFTGSEITSAVGITQGTAQFSNVGWLKFAIDGKIIFKSQKPYRHSISWDHINSKGAVDGTKTVSKNGVSYKVRLMKGLHENNPSLFNGSSNHGSEWNRLMLPIHENAPSSWAYSGNVNSPTEDWGINFTDADLHTHRNHGSGTYQWCQEVSPSNATRRVSRGLGGVSISAQNAPSSTGSYYGWSPSLEVF